jgi:hypothetical protein
MMGKDFRSNAHFEKLAVRPALVERPNWLRKAQPER